MYNKIYFFGISAQMYFIFASDFLPFIALLKDTIVYNLVSTLFQWWIFVSLQYSFNWKYCGLRDLFSYEFLWTCS